MTEPSAAVEVRVITKDGRPVEKAEVVMWPNILWPDFGTQVFGSVARSSDQLLKDAHPERDWHEWKATTDAKGVATIPNLPSVAATSLAVQHSEYELPIVDRGYRGSRDLSVKAAPGQTTRVEIIVQKKGKEFLGVGP